MEKSRANSKEVLEKYMFMSPSALPIEETTDEYKKIENRLNSILFHRLKFPRSYFNGITVADFGCGTGESAVILGKWGAKVHGIDFNPISIERANQLKTQFKLEDRLSFSQADILKPDHTRDNFDFVMSDGVLPHVEEPYTLLNQMATHTKPGGFMMLGYLDLAANSQRLIHGVLTRALAKNLKNEELTKVAYTLFPEHFDRALKYGRRSIEATVNDYIGNVHSYGVDTVSIIQHMTQKGFSLHTSYPLVASFINEIPADQYTSEEIEKNLLYWRVQQLSWVFSSYYNEWKMDVDSGEDVHALLVDLEKTILSEKTTLNIGTVVLKMNETISLFEKKMTDFMKSHIRNGLDELLITLNGLQAPSLSQESQKQISSFKRMFKGFNGFPTMYLSFFRNS